MRIAVAYPTSTHSAWSVAEGVVETLERMGYEVLPLAFATHNNLLQPKAYPTFEELSEVDAILVASPEHLRSYLAALYPKWRNLKPPKAGWMCETIENQTYKIRPDDLKAIADVIFCPGRQDEKHGFHWLPFGVDTQMFRPTESVFATTRYEVGFIGLLYPERRDVLRKLLPHLPDLRYGEVRSLDPRLQAETYATELRRMRIFLNLPAINQFAVTKCYEAAASGCLLITPRLPDNPQEFGLFYESGDIDGIVRLVRHVQAKPELATEQIDRDCRWVHEHDSLESRLTVILNAMAVGPEVSRRFQNMTAEVTA